MHVGTGTYWGYSLKVSVDSCVWNLTKKCCWWSVMFNIKHFWSVKLSMKITISRVVFTWVRKVIHIGLGLAPLHTVYVSDWLKKLTPLPQPIRSKTKTNWYSFVHIYPWFMPATCICFGFWLVQWPVCMCLLWLAKVIALVWKPL